MNAADLLPHVFQDWNNNPGDPKIRFLLAFFRWSQRRSEGARRPYVREALYRLFSELVVGTELRPQTRVGPGLTVYHGYGLVVNDAVRIGSNVTLRNGVVIGNKVPDGPCPVIEDHVVVGANAVIIGGLTVGTGAQVGAGAVVTRDVPPGAVVVGNPARVIDRRDPQTVTPPVRTVG